MDFLSKLFSFIFESRLDFRFAVMCTFTLIFGNMDSSHIYHFYPIRNNFYYSYNTHFMIIFVIIRLKNLERFHRHDAMGFSWKYFFKTIIDTTQERMLQVLTFNLGIIYNHYLFVRRITDLR